MAELQDRYSICVERSMEGYLEKKETSVLRSKTSKRWCWVQGSTFYQKKVESNNGPGQIEVLDMGNVKFVRKVSTDTTQTQFEIIVKKPQVFISTNRDECTAWVKALQVAMTKTEPSQLADDPMNIYTQVQDESVYAIIPDNNNIKKSETKEKANNINQQLNHQTSVKSKTITNQSHNAKTNGDAGVDVYSMAYEANESVYNEISDGNGNVPTNNSSKSNDIRGFKNSEQTKLSNNINSNKKQLTTKVVNGSGSDNDVGNSSVYNDACSTSSSASIKKFEKLSLIAPSSPPPKAHRKAPKPPNFVPKKPTDIQNRNDTLSIDKDSSDQPANVTTRNDSTTSNVEPENVTNLSETTNNEDKLMNIFDSMDLGVFDIPDLEYTVSLVDLQPVKALKSYLRENDAVCRAPRNRLSHNEASITACKKYIESIDDILKSSSE